MPTAIAIYFSAYIVFCVWAHYDDFKKIGALTNFGLAEVASNAFLLLAALVYWIPTLRTIPESAAFGLFSVGTLLFLFQGFLVGKKALKDPTISGAGRVFTVVAGMTFGMLITSPLLCWGWYAAVLHVYAEP